MNQLRHCARYGDIGPFDEVGSFVLCKCCIDLCIEYAAENDNAKWFCDDGEEEE